MSVGPPPPSDRGLVPAWFFDGLNTKLLCCRVLETCTCRLRSDWHGSTAQLRRRRRLPDTQQAAAAAHGAPRTPSLTFCGARW